MWKEFADWGEDMEVNIAKVDVTEQPGKNVIYTKVCIDSHSQPVLIVFLRYVSSALSSYDAMTCTVFPKVTHSIHRYL